MQPSWLLVYRQTTYIILMITIAPPPKEPIIKDAETAPKGEVSSNWELWFSLLAKRVSQLVVASASSGTVTSVGLTTAGDGLAISGSPVTTAGVMSVVLDDDAAALEALSSTGGAFRTGANTWALRVISSGTGVSIVDGNGVAGNPTIALAALADEGTGTLLKITRDGFGRVSGTTPVVLGDLTGVLGTTYVTRAGDTMTGALGMIAGSAALPGIFISGDTNTGLYSSALDTIDFSTSGTRRMTIAPSGRVGVGTGTPGAGLHVSSSSDLGGRIEIESTGGFNPVLQFHRGASYMYWFFDGTHGYLRTDNTSGHLMLQSGAAGTQGYVQIGNGGSAPPTPTGQLTIKSNTPASSFNVLIAQDYNGNSRFSVRNDGDTTVSGSLSVGKSITIAAGGTFVAGSIYTDANWGMLFKAASAGGVASIAFQNSSGTELIRILNAGNVGIGGITPTATLHIKAGSAAANSAPLKFNSGSLNTTAEVGAVEFLTDKYYAVITTGAARKEITLNDAALTSGRVPFATTNGRLTDDADLTFSGDTLSAASLRSTNPLQQITTGAAAVVGNATLVAGTVTVSTTAVKTSSVVILTRKATGGTPGAVITYTISSGVSFTINSDNVADTSTFSWLIVDTY